MALAHGGFEVGVFRLARVVHANKTHVDMRLIFLYLDIIFCTRQLRSVSPIEGQMELTSHLAPVRKLSA